MLQRGRLALALALWAGAGLGCMGDRKAEEAKLPGIDLILHGGKLYTLDPTTPGSTALAVRGDRIVKVGSDEQILALAQEQTRRIDLEGRAVVPGLIDSHLHMKETGKNLEQLRLRGSSSPEEVARRVQEAVATASEGAWIQGRGWDQMLWQVPEFPTAKVLDEVSPRNPVVLRRIDGHALWANSLAMSLAGVNARTPDPPGGRILRYPDSGEPSGVFVDDAEELIQVHVPPETDEDFMRWVARTGTELLKAGVTSAHDAGVTPQEIGLYLQMVDWGRLPLRVYAMVGDSHRFQGDHFARTRILDYGDHRFTFRTIKLGVDGALGSRGAALLAPYSDEPDYRGHITMPLEVLRRLTLTAVKQGFQVAIHAIGDRGNRLSLDVLKEAARAAPGADLRSRIEHAQVLSPQDIPRFGAQGIIAAVQPIHATDDMHMAPARLGPERLRGAYAWRSLRDASATLAFGSDAPFASWNPWEGLQAAVTRQNKHLEPAGGWRSEECLSREAALRGFTVDAAYAAFEERDKGTLTPGKLADFVVLDRDYFEIPDKEIAQVKPVLTILGGKIVYQAPAGPRETRPPE